MATNNITMPVAAGTSLASKNRGGHHSQLVESRPTDGPALDAFGRQRVSEPHTIFDSKLLGLDQSPLFWELKQVSGASTSPTTPTAAKPYTDLASINVTAGVYVRQTYRRFNYQPGKSQLILMTGVLELASGVTTGCVRRIGYFDDNNGAYFESNAGVIGIATRSNDSGSPVSTTVTQANWNLDNLDGGDDAANPSGVTADWAKAQIFVVDFQWLSVGRVRFGVMIGGELVYVHEVLQANVSNIPWASTPSLPLRYELTSTTDSGVCSMRCICAVVISEGGSDENGIVLRGSTAGTGVVTTTENVIYAVYGLRLKTTHVGTTVKFLNAHMQLQTDNEYAEWLLIWNPTVADGGLSYSGITNSSCEEAIGATAKTVTGGTQIAGGYLQSGKDGGAEAAELANALILGVDIAGTSPDELVLCVRPIGGVSALSVEGGMAWREVM